MGGQTKLILASASPVRKALLDWLGIEYKQVSADIDESEVMDGYLSAKEIVTTLALKKAEAVKEKLGGLENNIIVACDTVVTRGSKEIMGKPKDSKEAKEMLMKLLRYSDRAHTGICILDPLELKPIVEYGLSEMILKDILENDIDQYIASGEPLRCAGALNPGGKFAKTFAYFRKGFFHAEYSFPFEYLVPSLRNHGLLPDLGPRTPTITLCSSAKFFDKLPDIRNKLSERGYSVLLPSMKDFHDLEETALMKIQHGLIKDHFAKIDDSDAIYVANYTKKDIKGYIGGNTFLEMGKAFDKGIYIFLLNDLPKQSPYREELLAMKPIVIGKDWKRLDDILRNK
jgi:septum formation protein